MKLRLFAATYVIVGLSIFVLPLKALAACTPDMRYHVDLGLDFLKEAQAYDNRDERELAKAERENLGHQVEMVDSEMISCDDAKLNRDFALIAAWDAFNQFTDHAADDTETQRALAHLFRARVSTLYAYAGAKYYRRDYMAMKAVVKVVYDTVGLPYCSPEEDENRCRAVEAKAAKAAAAAAAARTAQQRAIPIPSLDEPTTPSHYISCGEAREQNLVTEDSARQEFSAGEYSSAYTDFQEAAAARARCVDESTGEGRMWNLVGEALDYYSLYTLAGKSMDAQWMARADWCRAMAHNLTGVLLTLSLPADLQFSIQKMFNATQPQP